MKALRKIIKYELQNILRSKWILIYTLFFFLLTDSLFRFGGSSGKVVLSLMNVILLIIPLVSVVFGVMYLYNSREYIELMLSQPLKRRTLFLGLYIGLTLPLTLGFLVGSGLPFLIHGVDIVAHQAIVFMLLLSGIFLTIIFVALAFLISTVHEDRVKGLGTAIISWLLFAIIYDGLILMITYMFIDYPLEKPVIALTLLNPIDLARILIMLKLDIAALMGYTGAVFEKFFAGSLGLSISFLSLILWSTLPIWIGSRMFERKNF